MKSRAQTIFHRSNYRNSSHRYRSILLLALIGLIAGGLLLPQTALAADDPVSMAQDGPPLPPVGDLSDGLELDKPPLTGGTVVENPVFADPDAMLLRQPMSAAPASGPTIDIWYNDTQHFGENGRPIRWVNVLGNVSPANNIKTLDYQLNGGSFRSLDIGSTLRRLYFAGDFSVELDYTQLTPGDNTVTIQARDKQNNVTTQTVIVNYTPNQTWSLPYAADWSQASQIEDVAQSTDGLWAIVGDVLKPQQLAYDRLVVIGDMTDWVDYEVTVPVTIHGIDAGGFGFSGGPGLGLILRWQGQFCWTAPKYPVPDTQLCNGWQRLGAINWFRWAKNSGVITAGLQRVGAKTDDAFNDVTPETNNTTYIMKAQVQNSASCGGKGYYRFKVWKEGGSEPGNWNMAGCETDTNGEPSPTSGSLALVAHHVDASFGRVLVTPIGYQAELTISPVSGGSAAASPQQAGNLYDFYDEVTLTATPEENYSFAGWTITLENNGQVVKTYESINNPLVFNMEGDTTAAATFEQTAFTVGVTRIGNGEVIETPAKALYMYGEEVMLEAMPDPGWRFEGWSGAISGTNLTETLTVTQHSLITATFGQEYYTLTNGLKDIDGASDVKGVITVDPANHPSGYVYGETVGVEAIAVTALGWSFVRWEGALSGSQNPATFNVDGDATVTGLFQREQYTLTTEINGLGAISTSVDGPYLHGQEVQVTAIPAEGWAFEHWQGDIPISQSEQETASIIMDDNKSVMAVFMEKDHPIYLPVIKR